MIQLRALTNAACALALAGAAFAQTPTTTKSGQSEDVVVVWGRAIDLIGDAHAASEGIIGYADFETRPISRAGELVEVIPGVIATQHSGEGKANQYFLRGFNLDHGTDFSASVDGVPVNIRTHGHGQGYLDLNFIIPEIVERVEYSKGPYAAANGDFSAAGSSRFIVKDRFDRNFGELTLGENNYVRGVAGASVPLGEFDLLVVGEGQVYDGPWVLKEDLQKVNGVAKLTRRDETSSLSFELFGYDSSWTSTDQIPQRAVDTGEIDRLGFIDGDLGGKSSRYSATVKGSMTHGDGSTTTAQAYAIDYDFRLVSNFTYFLEDPIDGDEFVQRDERQIYGGQIEHDRPFQWDGRTGHIRLGADTRFDDIGAIGLFHSINGVETSAVREDRVKELSVSAFTEAEIPLTDRLRATVGARVDYFDAEVDALTLTANGGSSNDTLVSPSIALAWRATDALELYANYGQGFHSNDVRGTTITIDPASGDPVDKVNLLVAAEGAEFGARWEKGNFNATLSVFALELDGELVFVGDAGTTEPNDATRRYGVEVATFWEATDWLVFDASAAYTDAKFKGVDAGQDEIPGAVESVLAVGAVARWGDFSTSLRVRHFGPAPLIEDGSVASDGTTIVNLGATYEFGAHEIRLDALNILDSNDNDITYFYESRLAGEPAEGIADKHFHPVEPRQLRLSLKLRY